MEIKRGFALFYFFMLVSGLLICFSSSVTATSDFGVYFYAGYESHSSLYQFYTSNTTEKTHVSSSPYPQRIAEDSLYVYEGGSDNIVYRYWKTNLSVYATHITKTGDITGLASDGTYLYVGSAATSEGLSQYWCSNMTFRSEYVTFYNKVTDILCDETYVYCVGGADLEKTYQFYRSNLTLKAATTGVYFTDHDVTALAQDDLYLYETANQWEHTRVIYKSNMTYKTGDDIYDADQGMSALIDGNYLYVCGHDNSTDGKHLGGIWKYNKTTLAYVSKWQKYTDKVDAMECDGTYLYAAFESGGESRISTIWMSNMTQKSRTEPMAGSPYFASDLSLLHYGTYWADLSSSDPSPDGSVSVPITTPAFNVTIVNPLPTFNFSYTIQSSRGDSASGYTPGAKSLALAVPLPSATSITVWVNQTDYFGRTYQDIYLFTTEISKPTNASVSSVNIYQVNLSWTKGAGSDYTYIRFDSSNHTPWLRTTGSLFYNGTASSYIGNVLPGNNYFALWSYNSTSFIYGPGGASGTFAVGFPSVFYPPTTAVATTLNTTAINVSWTMAAFADRAYIRYDTTNHATWLRTNGTFGYNGTGTSYVQTVPEGDTFYFAFWSYNSTGNVYGPDTSTLRIAFNSTSIDNVSAPTAVSGAALGTSINLSWTKWNGATKGDRVLVFWDTINHTNWTRVDGHLAVNTTASYFHNISIPFATTRYYALFSYNSTFGIYSTTAAVINRTTTACPVARITSLSAVMLGIDSIRVNWSATAGADCVYIEFNFDVPVGGTWDIGDGTFAMNITASNGTADHLGLNNNRMYWYCAWGYNATENCFSILGREASARTGVNPLGNLLVGTNYHDMYHLSATSNDFEWVDYILPANWQTTLDSIVQTWWASKDGTWRAANPVAGLKTSVRNMVDEDVWLPYSWWLYFINDGHMNKPGTTRWDEWKDKTGSHAWHIFQENTASNVEMLYDTNISGGITGIGFYLFDGSAQTINLKGRTISTHDVWVPSHWLGPADRRLSYTSLDNTFPDYRTMPSPPGYEFDDVQGITSTLPSRVHLQINNEPMPSGVIAQDGFDEFYNQQKFIYFDLKEFPIDVDNETVFIKLLIDGRTGSDTYAFFTQVPDVDADGTRRMWFSTGNDAINNFNKDVPSGIYDDKRELCYFFTYDPNIHQSPYITGPSNITMVDQLIVTPTSVGNYETVNIIYFTQPTLSITNLSIFASSNLSVPVYSKFIEMQSGNILFTPVTPDIYTVELIRGGNVTYSTQFQVLAQTPHGYVYPNDNPVYTNQIFSIKAYYDLPDFPGVLKIEREDGTIVSQWTIPNNRSTNLYTYSTQLGTEGVYYLKLYQQRTYDEQMVTQNALYVKDREYVPSITLSTLQPTFNNPCTISVVNNIVGVPNMNLNYYLVNQANRKVRVDPVGNGFKSSVVWIPALESAKQRTGTYTLKLECHDLLTGLSITMVLATATVNVGIKEDVDPDPTPPAPVIDIPALISQAGPAFGITDPMFRIIIGVLIVLLIMVLPLIIAWKAQLKYADRIITNPMVYSVTAIIGSLISYALALFPLWIFILIFIVSITFLIRAWRGQGSSAAGE